MEYTTKEIRLLQMVADGKTRKEIAGELEISNRTVEDQLDKIRRKTEDRTIIPVIVKCFRKKLIK